MNIVVAIMFGLKRAPESIKMQYFEWEHEKNFLEPPPPDPTPVGAFGASMRVPLALFDRPYHISRPPSNFKSWIRPWQLEA